MRPLSVIVVQSNAALTESLANSLNRHFRVVKTAPDLPNLRDCIHQSHADVAIVDLEVAGVDEVRRLKQEFGGTTIVCTHRLANEQMWAAALAAGASDCCYSSDVRAIVLAATNTKFLAHTHAA